MSAATHAALDAKVIERVLRALAPAWSAKVVVRDSTGSTNHDAKALAAEGAPAGTVVVANEQTAGRGRSGNTWHSPPDASLYLSVVLRPSIEPARAAPLALVAGVVVAGVVDARLDPAREARARIKWPNDVWLDDKKLAGILVESQIRGAEVTSVIAGIGLNAALDPAELPADVAARATSLSAAGVTGDGLDRSTLAGEIAARMLAAVNVYGLVGLAPFLHEIRSRDALLGRDVRVGDVSGTARGVDDEGRLIIEGADNKNNFVTTGHVSLPGSSWA
ncbi:MAG: biotin--[acetyl-CoA-carboxylase] ligase [Polyangiaceae bacterium]